MSDRPVCRRQFLGSAAAAAAVGPSAALGPTPVPLVRPLPSRVYLAPEALPAGVARQFGAARFRESDREFALSISRFSADGRWLLMVSDVNCVGYELPTARQVRFDLRTEPEWTVVHWSLTTDGRLAVIEQTFSTGQERTRLRWYDLPTGRPHPPISLPHRIVGVSPDGSLAVLDRLARDPGGCYAIHLRTGQTVWDHPDEFLPCPITPCGRFVSVGAFHKGGVIDRTPTLIDVFNGRKVTLTSAGDGHSLATDERPAGVSADGTRLMVGVKPAERNWADRVVVWDTRSGKIAGVIRKQETDRPFDASYPIGLTADGTSWFGVDGDDRQLVVHDLKSGDVTRRMPVFDVDETASAVTPDGKTLLLGRTERGKPVDVKLDNILLRVIDAGTGATLPHSPDPPGPIVRVWFPSATTVAAAFRPRAGHLDYITWDVTTGRGRRFTDPTDRNEPARPTDPDPIPLVSPDLAHTLRLLPRRLSVHNEFGFVVGLEPPPSANARWFWQTADTVGIFSPAGLHLWEWRTGDTRVIPLALPGKWPHVWRWRVSADAGTVVVQFLPHLSERACRVGWIDVTAGTLTVSDASAPGSGEGFAASADGGRAAVLLGKQTVYVFDRHRSTRGMFRTDPVDKGFDLTACGRTAVMQCYQRSDDTGQLLGNSLQLWETATGQRRHTHPLSDTVSDLRASACGRFVATVRADQPVYLWDIYGESSDPQPEPTADDLPKVWADLTATAAVSFRAIRRLVQHPLAAVRLLGAKLTPAVAPKRAWVDERIDRLGDPDYRVRESAERELTAVADVAAGQLRTAADTGLESEEAEERLSRVVGRASAPWDWLRTVRAVEVLEYAGGASGPLLSRLSNGTPGLLSREATAAIRRRKEGRPPEAGSPDRLPHG